MERVRGDPGALRPLGGSEFGHAKATSSVARAHLEPAPLERLVQLASTMLLEAELRATDHFAPQTTPTRFFLPDRCASSALALSSGSPMEPMP
jgi:hypothetical protein